MWLQTTAFIFRSSSLINEEQFTSTKTTPTDFIISSPLIQMGWLPLNTADSAVMEAPCVTDMMKILMEYEQYLHFPAKRQMSKVLTLH